MSEEKNKSEVARLLKQFDDEYQAAQNGLSGLAYGVSQHAFITAKMEAMEKTRQQMNDLLGEDETTKLIVESMNEKDKRKDG